MSWRRIVESNLMGVVRIMTDDPIATGLELGAWRG